MAKRKHSSRAGGRTPGATVQPAAAEAGPAAGSATREVAATAESSLAQQCGERRGDDRRDPLSRTIHLVICAFILVAPYFQGLFFEKQRFVAEIGVFLVGAVWAAVSLRRWSGLRRSGESRTSRPSWPGAAFPRGSFGLCAVGMTVAYFIAIPGAASMRSALGEALTAAMLLVVLWLVVESSGGERDLDLVLKAISASGMMIAAVGMATPTKVFVFPSAWEGGRLFSTLQYANSAASALLASFFASATAWLKSRPACEAGSTAGRLARGAAVLESVLWGFTGAFAFAGFVLTQSRAAWLVFPLAAAFFVAGSSEPKLAALAYVVVAAAAGVVAAARFASFLQPLDAATAWKWALGLPVVAGVVLGVVGALTALSSTSRLQSRGTGPAGMAASSQGRPSGGRGAMLRLAAGAVGIALCFALVAGVVAVAGSQAAGPLARLRSYALTDESLQSRIIWPLDAVRIALHHPVTGTGGGGWALVYPRYREYPYYTKLVHSHFAQVLVDTGLVGLSAFLAFWFHLLRAAWWTVRNPEAGAGLKTTVWGAAAVAAGLGAHGAVDFSLSLPAVAVFLWAAAGVVYRGSRAAVPTTTGLRADPRAGRGGLAQALSHVEVALSGRGGRRAAAVGCILAVLVTCSLAFSGVYATRAVQAWSQKKPDEAIALLRTAARLDPLSGPIRADLGQWYEALAGARKDRDLAKRCVESFAAAMALSPYDSPIRLHYAAVLFNSGQTAAAIRNAQVAIANNKFLPLGYEVLTGLYVESGKRLALAGRADEAKKAFSMALDVLGALEKTNASIPERYRRFIRPEAQLTPTTTMGVYRAQAKFFLGRREDMYEDLKPALADPDPVVKAKALFWEAMMVAATGDHSTAGLKLREALKVSPELADEGPRTKEIATRLGLDYKLEPRSR